MTTFDNIKKFSKQRGLSLQEVAKQSGLSSNVIYQYKGKTNPSMETLGKIAKTLGVDVRQLMDGNSTPVSNDIDEALGTIMSFDGKPVTDHDRKVMKSLLESYLKNKQ